MKNLLIVSMLFLIGSSTIANAQFGGFLKEVEKLEKIIVQPKAQPAPQDEEAQPSARGALPEQQVPRGQRHLRAETFNCHNDDDLVFTPYNDGGFAPTKTISQICVPRSSYITNEKMPYDVKRLKMIQQNLADYNCQFDHNNTSMNKITGGKDYLTANLVCDLDGTLIGINLTADDTQYHVTRMSMAICGPEIDSEGSAWNERIISKYAGIEYDVSRNGITDYYAITTAEMENVLGKAMPREFVRLDISRGAGYPHSSFTSVCSAGTVEWTFSMSTGGIVNNNFERTMMDRVKTSQSAGDDF